jgi:hypothetical protein
MAMPGHRTRPMWWDFSRAAPLGCESRGGALVVVRW